MAEGLFTINYPRLSGQDVEELFKMAGIPILKKVAIIDGYGYPADDERFYEKPARCCWWMVKTVVGYITIGWRKRVVSISWEDTPIRMIVTEDDVTKGMDHVHAYPHTEYGNAYDVLRYLTTLGKAISELHAKMLAEQMVRQVTG